MIDNTGEAIALLKRKSQEILVEADPAQRTMHTFWVSLCWYMFGVCTGAAGMVYQYEMQPQDGARETPAMEHCAPTHKSVKQGDTSAYTKEFIVTIESVTP